MNEKVTILLGSVCVVLAFVTAVIFVNTSSMLNDKDILITNLQNQVDTLGQEMSPKTRCNDLEQVIQLAR